MTVFISYHRLPDARWPFVSRYGFVVFLSFTCNYCLYLIHIKNRHFNSTTIGRMYFIKKKKDKKRKECFRRWQCSGDNAGDSHFSIWLVIFPCFLGIVRERRGASLKGPRKDFYFDKSCPQGEFVMGLNSAPVN